MPQRRGRFRAGLALVVLALLTGGCRALFGLEEGAAEQVEEQVGPPWWIENPGTECERVRAPTADDRPGGADSESEPPIYLALRSLRVGAVGSDIEPQTSAWRDIGLDLDGACTAVPECEFTEPVACSLEVDGNGCRDNVLGSLIPNAMSLNLKVSELAWACELRRGTFNIVIAISGYNGRMFDPEVRLDAFTSVGISGSKSSTPCPASAVPSSLPDPLPAPWWEIWERRWHVVPESIAGSRSKCSDGAPGLEAPAATCSDIAFVRDGYLAATFSDAVFWLNGANTASPGFRTRLVSGALVGRLRRDDRQLWILEDAALGGITTPGDILDGFRRNGVCVENEAFLGDILSARQDTLLPDSSAESCDALSVGWVFSASQTGGLELMSAPADGGSLPVDPCAALPPADAPP